MDYSAETLYNGTSVYVSGAHRFGTDAMLLSAFCRPRRAERAVDLCSGCGIVALRWHDLGHRGPCLAVEKEPEGTALLELARCKDPELAHILPLCMDLNELPGTGEEHLVAANPPYFTGGRASPSPARAAAFGSADFVAAEDTRVTLKLLNHLGLKKPMVSYYEHNLKERGDYILSRIEAGESCALCSDAGMPAISDPGEVIVRDALARGIRVAPVPGPSACVTALAVSGQATGRFVFEGFLPMNARQRRERLAALAGEERTVIFYEAPHKLRATLADLAAAFGPERGVTLARELTKLHEEVDKTTLGAAAAHYAENAPRGEYVLVMEGAAAPAPEAVSLQEAAQRARRLIEEGLSPTAAAKQAAAGTPYSKSEVYRLLAREGET